MSKRNELIAEIESKQRERNNIRQKMQPDIMSMAPSSIPTNLYQMYIKQLETLDNDINMLTELVKTLPAIPDAATTKEGKYYIFNRVKCRQTTANNGKEKWHN